MKSITRLIATITVSIASVASYEPLAAHEPSSAAAERVLEESLYDLTGGLFFFSCSADGEPLPQTEGEPIAIEGQLYERFSVLIDGAGGYHYSMNTMPVDLRGISETSGEEFRVSEEDRFLANQRLAGGVGTYRQELKMVGKDSHRAFRLISNGNYVVSADGDVIVSRDSLRLECNP